jgi:hypothetical protein
MKSILDIQASVNAKVASLTADGIDPATVPFVIKSTNDNFVYEDAQVGCVTHEGVRAGSTSIHVEVFDSGSGSEKFAVIE